MSKPKPINEFDIIFISYDEPNADKNYADLLNKAPWAKRSHGVKGSDACHKAAAALAETNRFVTVDADNIVQDDFFNIELDMSKIGETDVISWAGKNVVNGLIYGNGGIKLWPKSVVMSMKTHENASAASAQVDFCWDIHYHQMNNVYCWTHNNGSAYQAFRAGFREGVKMCLAGGIPVSVDELRMRVHPKNYRRLLVWHSVGADAENGLWAMYGARLGTQMTLFDRSFDYVNVRDFDWHDENWKNNIQPKFSGGKEMCAATGWAWDSELLKAEIKQLGTELRTRANLQIAELDENGSRFFKESYINPNRLGPMIREDQVIQGVDGF
jgi:hypothetical protein